VHAHREADLARHAGQRLLAHQAGAQLGELAFGKLRKAGVEHVGHRAAEHAVAEKLEPLVVLGAVAAMRQRLLEEARIGERVTQQLYEPPFVFTA
jgi:hypothetical protein